jgi:hypothetical protein
MPRTYKNRAHVFYSMCFLAPNLTSNALTFLVVSIPVYLSSLNTRILLFQVLSYHATASNKEVEVLLVS